MVPNRQTVIQEGKKETGIFFLESVMSKLKSIWEQLCMFREYAALVHYSKKLNNSTNIRLLLCEALTTV